MCCLIILLVACSSNFDESTALTATSIAQNETPDFVIESSIHDEYDNCIEISQASFWEEGDTGRSLANHLSSTTRVLMDGERYLTDDEIVLTMHLSSEPVWNSDRELLATVSGPVTICVYPVQIWWGTHVMTLQLSSTSGTEYEYSWIVEK